MSDCEHVGVGLSICQSIDGMFCGVKCNQVVYEPNDLIFLHVALRGRPSTVKSRVLNLVVNNVVTDTITIDEWTDDFIHIWVLNDNYVGNLRVDYIENGLRYWSREFNRGTCIIPYDVERITSDRLIFNLMKIRGQI